MTRPRMSYGIVMQQLRISSSGTLWSQVTTNMLQVKFYTRIVEGFTQGMHSSLLMTVVQGLVMAQSLCIQELRD
jgi:hypothetical protein